MVVIGLFRLNRWLKVAPLWRWQLDLFAVDPSPSQATTTPDALVVLGYCVNHWTREPTQPLLARLQLAVDIACEDALKHRSDMEGGQSKLRAVIFTGGSAPRIPLGLGTESDIMSASFSRLWQASSRCSSLPEPRHILERFSTSTFENARYTLAQLLREEEEASSSMRNMQIVTNRFHQWRAIRTFEMVETRRQGEIASAAAKTTTAAAAAAAAPAVDATPFTFTIAPMPHEQSEGVPQLDFIREVAACLLYAVRRWI
jgi:hypothetical protein